MAHRAYLYIGNMVEYVGQNLESLTGVCQHAHEVSLLQKVIAGNAPRIIPSPLFESGESILADRAGSFARVLALLDRLAEGEVPDRDAFLSTSSDIREFLRGLPHTSHVLLEPGELFADFDPEGQTRGLLDEIETTYERVARAIRGDDEAYLAELRRDWRAHIASFWSQHLYYSFSPGLARLDIPREKPRGAWIARGGGQRCVECHGTIDEAAVHDATRIDVIRPDVRITHLACALWSASDAVRIALGDVREGAVVEPWIETSLATDLALYTAAEPLFAPLLDDPEDLRLLGRFAERLAQVSDPYAEVIATDIAVATQPADAALRDHQRQLHERYAPGYREWGVGFLRSTYGRPALAPHNALLTELRYWGWEEAAFAAAAATAPRSLRRLEIQGHWQTPHTGAAMLVAALPRLADLALDAIGIERIAHPTLRRLSIGLGNENGTPDRPRGQEALAELLRTLAPGDLPSVVELALRPRRREETTAVCEAIVNGGWLAQLDRLVVRGSDASALVALVPALGQRRLTIELDDAPIPSALVHELRKHAEVIAPGIVAPAFAVGARVEHTGKPEWGTGRVTSVRGGKIEILFGKTARTFKTDAAFLRIVEAP